MVVLSDTTARTFNGSGIVYLRLLTEFDMLVFFTNSSLVEFQVRYFALFPLVSVMTGLSGFGCEVCTRIPI